MTPDKRVEERLVLDTTNNIMALFPQKINGVEHINYNHKVDEIIRTTLTQYHQDLMSEVVEKIICSAIKMMSGEIVRGHRHHDCIRTARDIPRLKEEQLLHQGFMTSSNRFVEREEAKLIAEKAGQIIKQTNSPLLFSEDIY